MQTGQAGLVTEIPGWEYLKEHGYTEIRGEAIVVEDWPVQFIPVSNPLEEEALLLDIIKRHGLEKEWGDFQAGGLP